MTVTVACRKAVIEDVDQIHQIIREYADKGIMLPRSQQTILSTIDTFVVAEAAGKVVGCGSLCQLGSDLVEIRSLGVLEEYKGHGIGSRLVGFLLEQAKRRGIPKVMALTYEVKFFERNGFHVVPKEIFPEKVWTDCIYCKKQHCCDEIAVLKRLD
ncbi:N-acetyltransferase [Ferviditalea candida]|uniref:N-acetyltransferase n=1 Tax=Ferviditalea candida TaxID=3108399 RepID=A0ABU5ZDY8_9BACL|nr:N-acetyltransferase [Paenibacillaceae bacterium T2]